MKKILLCIFVFMTMFLVLAPLGLTYDRDITFDFGKEASETDIECLPQYIKTDFGVDYIGYTIHDPGRLVANLSGLTMKNSNNGKCGNCHMNLSIDNVPEPKQRSPDMMKSSTI